MNCCDYDRAANQTHRGDLPSPTGPLADDAPEGPGALVAVACIGVWFIAVGLVFGLGGYVWSLTQ